MNIIVCVKQIALAYHSSALDIATGAIVSERLIRVLNPYDEIAVEQALRLKAAMPQATITLLSGGGSEMDAGLRYGYAMGGKDISRLIRLDTDASDAAVMARELARLIRSLEPDLLLCGKLSLDTQAGVMCAFLAEYLRLPQISCALQIAASAVGPRLDVVIDKNVGKGNRERWRSGLPLVVSMDSGSLQPRYPRLADRLAAQTASIECVGAESSAMDSSLAPSETYSLPRPKTRRVAAVDSSLSAQERIGAMSSAPEKKAVTVIDEPAPEAAQRVLTFLREHRFI